MDAILLWSRYAIAFTPFEQCQPLSREFNSFPPLPGIYAIRHKTDGLLHSLIPLPASGENLVGRFSFHQSSEVGG